MDIINIIIQIIIGIFWFLIILIPLVVIHEFGHLIMARLTGTKVLEFGVGIPPRAAYTRWKGIVWSVNWLMLGGFAKIYGDHDALDEAHEQAKIDPAKAKEQYVVERFQEIFANQELPFFLQDNNMEYNQQWKEFEKFMQKKNKSDSDEARFQPQIKQLNTLIEWEFDSKLDTTDAFFNKKWWQQTIILLGGVTFNMITAIILFFTLFAFIGTPNSPATPEELAILEKQNVNITKSQNIQAFGISQDSALDKAGVKPRDELISLNGKDFKELQDINSIITIVTENKDKEIPLVYKSYQNGETKEVKLKPQTDSQGKPKIGLGSYGYIVSYKAKDPFTAFGMGFVRTQEIFTVTFKSLGQIAVALFPTTQDRSALDNVAGPVAVSKVSSSIFDFQGIAGIINLMAVISVGLAVFNILPLPALDGGRWIIISLNKIFKRRNKKLEATVISITMLLLLGLGVLIAVKDLSWIFTGKI